MSNVYRLTPDLPLSAPIYFDLREASPDYVFNGHSFDPALRPQSSLEFGSPIVGPVDGGDLQRFHALMAQEGLALQPTRMLYDRLYACERLAQGHASANASLRELAMRMFNNYQQAGEWIGLIH
ncbi:hypothetical protein LNV08_08930 [Paucibacter sp. TC2R-5]|uniref:hypothetical protein n=1 Tax=Paucibacter sp. TC2R-5 TaxID=2893555 RepID=UPI0021E4ED68|nr:hypothetical protein [Paucibacter sp. TC2R-5]MCV2359099.1 hypothetical protein [Paucibacter sp. TC2R-5]